jgi:hypothetical protein
VPIYRISPRIGLVNSDEIGPAAGPLAVLCIHMPDSTDDRIRLVLFVRRG